MDESLGDPEESQTPNADLIIALTDQEQFEQTVLAMQALFKSLYEEKRWIAKEEKLSKSLHEEKYWTAKKENFLIDQLRDVLDPLGWDIVRRPPGARRRPTSVEKTLKKIVGGTRKKRRKSRR